MRPDSLPSRSLLVLLLALSCGASNAQDRKAGNDGYVGLPVTGRIDDSRVLSERRGEQRQSEDEARDEAQPARSGDDARAKGAGRGRNERERERERDGERPVPAPRAAFAIPAGGITGVMVQNTGRGEQTRVPITFGQVFAPGDLPRGAGLAGKLADGTTLPLQVDVKASHPDGSVRHAVISALLPRLAGKAVGIALVKSGRQERSDSAPRPERALDTTLSVVVDGERYGLSLDALLKAQKPQLWLNGPVVTELQVAAPLRTAGGAEHPHLAARFAVRWYRGTNRARVDVSVENDWAYEPDPRNITYDVELQVGGKPVYTRQGLTHLHHARWRRLAWVGTAPDLHLRHDTAYLIDTQALPNYDRSVVVSDSALDAMAAKWDGPKTEPMGVGAASPAMPNTGGRNDIGLLPGWAAMYLLSMDARAKDVTLATADLAGSWSIHYRDRRSGLPISLTDYPYMTLLGSKSDTRNPKTGQLEAFPRCPPAACKSPYHVDTAHQPGFAYLPYLVTGDHYYLEELQFWAMYNVFALNPGYRKNIQGLLSTHQVRGQAWGLRTLGQAAYITPDGHPLKRALLGVLDSNLAWYNNQYSNNPEANKLGVIVNGPAVQYKGKTALAPWQDDFFTSAVGHLAELGFKDAVPLLKYKARFPVGRMVGDGACWLLASNYTYTVRPAPTAPYFDTIGQAYAATAGPEAADLPCGSERLASATKRKPGDMGGYAATTIGFPSNLQPALAYSVGVSGEAGRKAWKLFMSRSVKPDYGRSPQFAIVPR